MSLLHRGRTAELVDVISAGCWSVEASSDAVAFGFDFGVGEVDFTGYAGDVEAASVVDAAVVVGLEVGADGGEAIGGCEGQEGEGKEDEGEMHGGRQFDRDGWVLLLLLFKTPRREKLPYEYRYQGDDFDQACENEIKAMGLK